MLYKSAADLRRVIEILSHRHQVMKGVALVAVLEICLQTLVHQDALYLLQVELILVANQLDERHLVERVGVIDCAAEVP